MILNWKITKKKLIYTDGALVDHCRNEVSIDGHGNKTYRCGRANYYDISRYSTLLKYEFDHYPKIVFSEKLPSIHFRIAFF